MEDIHALQQPAAAHTLTQTNLLATVVCFLLQAWPVAASSPPCSCCSSPAPSRRRTATTGNISTALPAGLARPTAKPGRVDFPIL